MIFPIFTELIYSLVDSVVLLYFLSLLSEGKVGGMIVVATGHFGRNYLYA